MTQSLALAFEKAIRMLATHMPVANEQTRKPLLSHAIRVGMYLYQENTAKIL